MDDEALKRQFSRVPLSHTVRFRRENTPTFALATITNISLGGMHVKAQDVAENGSVLYLQFMAETGEIVAEGYARVAHASDDGMGLEFTKIDEKFIAYAQLVVSEALLQRFERP